jgi:hypothetical protein
MPDMPQCWLKTAIASFVLCCWNPCGPLGAQDPDADEKPPEKSVKAAAGKDAAKPDAEKKLQDFSELMKDAQKQEGLFNLYRKDEHLYAEIKPDQLEKPVLVPIVLARGMAMAGNPLNFGDEWVIVFRRVGDRIQVVRRNIHYRAPKDSPLQKAVEQNYTDSVLLALPVLSVNPNGNGAIIDLADIFLTDFAQLNLGNFDRSRSTWHKIKAFPENLEIQVEATYGAVGMGGRYVGLADDGVVDARGTTVIIHYSLVRLPDESYKPRLADDRVGYFLSAVKDFGSSDPDTQFVRMINRWRLEKADPKAKLSAPKKQIVWWVEDNVPFEYRPFVEEGIMEWNKAFEKIGFRNAIAVRWQQDGLRDAFDPEDINYCTFRWITTPSTFAMSGLRANPLTGEMIDGDVIFDASWIKAWKQEYAFLTGNLPAAAGAGGLVREVEAPFAVGRVLSPIMAIKQGYGLPYPSPAARQLRAAHPGEAVPDLVPAEVGPLQRELRRRQMHAGHYAGCQFALGMRPQMALASLALAARQDAEDGKRKQDGVASGEKEGHRHGHGHEADDEEEEDARAKKRAEAAKLPDELIGQMIKEVVMHEVGHSLGLRHNFRASTMIPNDQLHDTTVTRSKGMVGSVMDYNPMNIAPPGTKQGDYTTHTIGPYDYWAIEYGYKPIDGDEVEELARIAARSSQPELAYGTDDDFGNDDPLVNAYDLGSDPNQFARDRMKLAASLLKTIDQKVVGEDESWARLRNAFSVLLSEWGNAAYLASSHVGGQYVNYDHKTAKPGRDPVTPVPGSKQRESLKLVVEEVLSDKAFSFSPELLRKLTTERWYHWGSESMRFGGSVNYPLLEEIGQIQQIALNQCLSRSTLKRLQDHELLAGPEAEPLKMAEVFRAFTDGIWSECAGDAAASCSTIRRNLQRAHLKKLSSLVLGEKAPSYSGMYDYIIILGGGGGEAPADAKSLARLHLKEIDGKLEKALQSDKLDDTTKAHFEESRQRIAKVLAAGLDANEP